MDNFDGELPQRNPVFCSRIGAVLDLDRDDLGHPAHPGLWQQLLADRRPVERRGLYCPDCLENRPDRPEWMYVYERGGLRIAAHHNPVRRHHCFESDTHQAYRERYVRAAEADGHRVEVAAAGGPGRRRPRCWSPVRAVAGTGSDPNCPTSPPERPANATQPPTRPGSPASGTRSTPVPR